MIRNVLCCKKTSSRTNNNPPSPTSDSDVDDIASAQEPSSLSNNNSFGMMPHDPRLWGMSIRQMYEFAVEIYGSPMNILVSAAEVIMYFNENGQEADGRNIPHEHDNLSIYDVVDQYVKPRTKGTGLSLAVLLNKDDTQPTKAADLFLSHSWAEKFSYLVALLCLECFDAKILKDGPFPKEVEERGTAEGRFGRKLDTVTRGGINLEPYIKLLLWQGKEMPHPDTVVWFCAFAINQNAAIGDELGDSIMESPFAQVLKDVPRMLVIYNQGVDLYSRVWCVLEMYIGVKRKNQNSDFIVNSVGLGPTRAFMSKEWVETHYMAEVASLRDKLKSIDFENLDEMVALASGPDYGLKFARGFCEENPTDVRNANASVESDKKMIMIEIEGYINDVNEAVNVMRQEAMATTMLGLLDG